MAHHLNPSQVEELISNNLYLYSGDKNIARCFHSDYSNNPNLPALAIPGGDVGDIAVLLSASSTAGFELNIQKIIETFFELIGGKQNTTFTRHAEHSLELCSYLNDLFTKPEQYDLGKQAQNALVELKTILGLSNNFKSSDQGEHPNACIIIEAEYGLFPHYSYDSGDGVLNANVLVFQKSFIDQRHRELSKLLLKNGAIELFQGLDEDYLYEIISETTETHLFQVLKTHYSNLPIYFASVSSERKIKIQPY